MNGNGAGNGHKPSPDGGGEPVPVRRARPGERSASLLPTPEQLLKGCGIGFLAILLAALFWGWLLWREYDRENRPPVPGARGTRIQR